MKTSKLTKRIVESQLPGTRDIVLWDSALKGFGLKVTPKGKRVYFLYYRTNGNTQRRPTIGTHGEITAEQARKIASTWLYEIAQGGDPSQTRNALKQAPTMEDLCKRMLDEHSEVKCARNTHYRNQRNVDRLIIPTFGQRKVKEVTREDISALHHRLRHTPYQANRILSLLSKMMNLAEKWGYRADGTNPTTHIDKFKEQKRERYLSPKEFSRLNETLSEVEAQGTGLASVTVAIRLLILTGCRMNEILTLRWDWVNLDRNVLVLPESKTGPKEVHLNSMAIDTLNSIQRISDNPYVIVGAKPGRCLVNLQKPWRRIRKLAGLEDVRLHDLRHSFASAAVTLGMDLHMVGKLLGHSEVRTTHRYAHLASDPIKAANERVGDAIAAMMSADS